jgi:predicted nucleotidyltransferase
MNTQDIVHKLKPLSPEKIILFGSYAKDTMITAGSDIDLLLIMKTNKRPADRVKEVLKRVWGSIPHIEPQVLTPEEYERAIVENQFFITQEIIPHGKIIYEKN